MDWRLLRHLRGQWEVIKGARTAFFLLLLVGLGVGYLGIAWALEWLHREKTETQEQRIAYLLERFDEASSKIKTAQNEIEYLKAEKGKEVKDFPKMEDYKPIVHSGEKFENERIILDGHAYYNCEFKNVTLVYKGTTPLIFNHNEITPPVVLLTQDNPALDVLLGLLYGIGYLNEEIDYLNLLPGTKITRPKVIKRE